MVRTTHPVAEDLPLLRPTPCHQPHEPQQLGDSRRARATAPGISHPAHLPRCGIGSGRPGFHRRSGCRTHRVDLHDPGRPADRRPHAPVVVLTFDESLLAMGTQVVVTGPRGPVQMCAPDVAETKVSQNLREGPAGHYPVAWRVTAADGHPLSGTFTFTAAAAGNGAAATLEPD